MLVSSTLTVVQESPKATAVEMIQDCQQQTLIKLKGCRKLREDERRGVAKDGLSHVRSQIREHSLVE